MISMVERVARAIADVRVGGAKQRFSDEYAVAMARAAIEAMREPTVEMSDAAHDRLAGEGTVENVYTAMIDAAASGRTPNPSDEELSGSGVIK